MAVGLLKVWDFRVALIAMGHVLTGMHEASIICLHIQLSDNICFLTLSRFLPTAQLYAHALQVTVSMSMHM